MKKLLTLICIAVFSVTNIWAKHVDVEKAKQVGSAFLASKINQSPAQLQSGLTLAYTSASAATSAVSNRSDVVYFYVFNLNTSGFVMVSGDDQVMPVPAYSDETTFDPENIPYNTKKWLEEYKEQIRDAIENQVQATEQITADWNLYLSGSSANQATNGAVSPLVKTTWNQSPYYNSMCPSSSVTGCVATAMAQIMKYWNYPETGSGFHSYKHSTYGTLSANFGSTTYKWSSMPNSISSSNSSIATLMYHCGVSVDMDYSPQSSGAYVISDRSPVTNCAEYAFKTYFGYKSSLDGIERANYTQTSWINKLKTELDAGRPILYAGFGNGGGHAFVCDGYDNSDYFHFNWGWGGAYNGYFSINALNPSGTGTGGGSGGYNTGHQAIIGIEPVTPGTDKSDLKLYDYVSVYNSTIGYGQSFYVKTNIVNRGTGTFNGDYCAAAFDLDGNFVEYVEIVSGATLQGGYVYTNGITFTNDGALTILPGSYKIHIFYRPTGGQWVQISEEGSYVNSANLTVYNNNNIQLNSAITVTPSTLITGEAFSVNLNIVNQGTSTFKGSYGVGLFNLDGTLAQTIDIYDETTGLPSGYTYKSPYLTFSNSSVDVEPGTYLLAVQHNGGSGWQLTGTGTFQNPMKVTVQAPSIDPDIYEQNNSVAEAYKLNLSYSGNKATKSTDGSTLHTGTDIDFYKVELPSGYDYSITATLYDAYKDKGSTVFTCDALVSYSTNGSDWSDTYDDVISGKITVTDGGTLYFQVAPYFAGETGDYLLEFSVIRTEHVGIKNVELTNLISMYPNPANDVVNINYPSGKMEIKSIYLTDINGKSIEQPTVVSGDDNIVLHTEKLTAGMYMVQIETGKGILTRKLVISR